MLKQDRFFHYQATKGARSLGFSCYFAKPKVNELVNERGELQVWMNMTRANKADGSFNKKIARAVLRERQMELVRVRDIPAIICNAANKTEGNNAYSVKAGDFASLLKYFV